MADRSHCGYSSFAYSSPEVKTACLAENADDSCLIPGISGFTERSYPISRPLYMYTNGPASGDVKDYLDWILSDEAQCILLDNRYAPVREVNCEA